jgi:hypothetical protein
MAGLLADWFAGQAGFASGRAGWLGWFGWLGVLVWLSILEVPLAVLFASIWLSPVPVGRLGKGICRQKS